MKQMVKEYGGIILLYIVIFFGIVAIGSRMNTFHENDSTQNIVAVGTKG